MLLPGAADAERPPVCRFYMMFYMMSACSSASTRRLGVISASFAASAQSASPASDKYSASKTNIFTQCEATTDGLDPWGGGALRAGDVITLLLTLLVAFFHPVNKVVFTFSGMHFNSERINRRDCSWFFLLSLLMSVVLSTLNIQGWFTLLNVA